MLEVRSPDTGSQSVLLALEDGIRRIRDAREVMAFAAAHLARHLRVDRVCYAEMDKAGERFTLQVESGNGRLPPLEGLRRLDEFGDFVGESMRGGGTLSCDDTQSIQGLSPQQRRAYRDSGIRAHISVSLVGDTDAPAILAVHHAEPRIWTAAEQALVRDVGERTSASVLRTRVAVELRRSEARFRQLFESIDQGFCIIDVLFDADGHAWDYRFIEINGAFARHTGLADVVGRTAREVVADLEGSWYELYGEVALTGQPRRFEKQTLGMGGRWFEVYAFPLEGIGHQLGILFSDISERRRINDAVRESQVQLAAVIEHVPVGIGLFDTEGRYLMANPRLQELVGNMLPSREPRPRWRAYDAEGNLLLPSEYPSSRALRGETVPPTVDFHLYLDGEERWIVFGAVPLWRDGKVAGGISVAQDITERRRVESALRESEWRLSTLIEGIPQLVWRSSDRGYWTWASPQWEQFTGQSQQDAIGLGWLAAIHPEDRDATLQAWARAGEREEMMVEHRVRQADTGIFVWHSTRSRALKDPRGRIVEWLGTTTDIQQFKNLHARQRELLELQADQSRRKDEFLAILAHELRNPLAPLRTTLELLVEAGDAPFAPALARMQRQVDHMVRLVEDLLEVSRITHGTIDLRREPLDVNEVLQVAIDTSRPWIEQAGHQLEVALAPTACIVDGDPVRLAQVFSNLLNNAAKFTHAPGRIALASSREAGWLRISVVDNGVGMPPGRIGEIFNLFAQIRQEKQQMRSGLGIGLTLVRSIVELHGGRVSAHSDGIGQGSRFEVELPLVNTSHPGEDDMATEYPTSSHRHRVMVVDDNRDAADAIAEYLEFAGHDVAVAYDGEAALARFAGFAPEMVLMDLGMPGISGYDTATRMRALNSGAALTLVALSGWTHEEDKRRSREAGFDAHLAKPVEVATLRRLIEEHLGHD
ncbi:PAS domain S-box protein [Pseudomonas sp. R2.Fl]|nr:PAS domain S-box protein [Pseudomonas sp. R2.Fl]